MDSRDYYNDKLIEARELRGLTQKQVADELNVTVTSIKRAEHGIICGFNLLKQLCAFYSIPMDKIVVPQPEPARELLAA